MGPTHAPEAWSTKWWMGSYGGKTPKPHIAWSNTKKVGLLNLGRLVGWNYHSEEYKANRTAKTVVKDGGKKSFQGNKKQLKESQHFGCKHIVLLFKICVCFFMMMKFDHVCILNLLHWSSFRKLETSKFQFQWECCDGCYCNLLIPCMYVYNIIYIL